MTGAGITNAQLARTVARMQRDLGSILVGLAEGMWNPNFCSADASRDALYLCEEFGARIEHLKSRATGATR